MVCLSSCCRSQKRDSDALEAIIYFYKPIRLQLGRSLREQPDVHARLMSQYPQVAEWYYVILFGTYRCTIHPVYCPYLHRRSYHICFCLHMRFRLADGLADLGSGAFSADWCVLHLSQHAAY